MGRPDPARRGPHQHRDEAGGRVLCEVRSGAAVLGPSTAARLDAGGAPDAAIEDRAVDVQMLFADAGRHGAPSVADLIVAATAELAGLTVLHLDEDFELVAEVTGQPTERLPIA